MKKMTEQEINIIRGKMLVNAANQEELNTILDYINEIEALLDELDLDDSWGTEGWRHMLGAE